MCGAEVVFVTAYTDAKILERITNACRARKSCRSPYPTSAYKKP
jgi:hypothetical protein